MCAMTDSPLNYAGITLADLPPDIIRMIIPMSGDRIGTGMKLISRTWNFLTLQYLNRRFRPLEAVNIYGTLWDFKFNLIVDLNENDFNHFGLLDSDIIVLGGQKEPITSTYLRGLDYNALIQERDTDILNRIINACSSIRVLKVIVHESRNDSFIILRDFLASVRIGRLELCGFTDFTTSNYKTEIEEITRNHPDTKVFYNEQLIKL